MVITENKSFKSNEYWETRYSVGGHSGVGSYGHLAEFKAEIINSFIEKNKVSSVIEFGSGDGNQLKYYNIKRYIGIDVSATATDKCSMLYKEDNSKTFEVYNKQKMQEDKSNYMADLSMSIDVIYHLIEDNVYLQYIQDLFTFSNKFVCIYSSNTEQQQSGQVIHVRHRQFTDTVRKLFPNWKIKEIIKNRYPIDCKEKVGSFSDFYFFEKSVKL